MVFSSAIVFILSTVLFLSCKKGDVGPAGEAGPAGPEGPTGPIGAANVTQFNFPAFTHTGAEVSKTFNLPKADLDKSLVFVYVNPSNAYWYPLPGGTAGGTLTYRIYFGSTSSATSTVYVSRISGAGSETMTMRIVVIPAATQQTAARMNTNVNMNDYLAVAKYYNLPTTTERLP